MTLKKKPQRTCLGCRNSKNKTELIRIVRTPEGDVKVDPSGKANGRGAYLCRDSECLKRAIKAKALQKALKTEIPPDIGDRLLREIANGE
ncbi:MAG: YlxR family protein [Lachnospiraceae bacterium]|nr:YlxR family protein [Lachnospiraceae bacterium]